MIYESSSTCIFECGPPNWELVWIFEYSNIRHQIMDIQIWIFNFLVYKNMIFMLLWYVVYRNKGYMGVSRAYLHSEQKVWRPYLTDIHFSRKVISPLLHTKTEQMLTEQISSSPYLDRRLTACASNKCRQFISGSI